MDRDHSPRDRHTGSEPEASASIGQIDLGADGIARLRGTMIEVHWLAALFRGMEADEILRDYVSLDLAQLDAAKAYADRHPNPSHSYPSGTAKKAMREAKLDGLEKYLPRRR